MDHPNRDSLDISAQQLQTNVENTADKTKNSNSFERQAEVKNALTDRPVGDPEKNETNISQTNDDEPSEDHQYATPRELSLLSTVFTIATFMIAIDGSILGKKKIKYPAPCPAPSLHINLLSSSHGNSYHD